MNLKKRQVDTAEQYPIPSDALKPEGFTEEIIGRWVAKDKTRTGWVFTSQEWWQIRYDSVKIMNITFFNRWICGGFLRILFFLGISYLIYVGIAT